MIERVGPSMSTQHYKNTHITYMPKEKRIENNHKFSQKKITFDDTPLFFPAGLEKIFLIIYFIALPYISGIMFLFFYVGERSTELFLSLNDDSSFILTWAIGYEILSCIILLFIIKSAISFSMHNASGVKKNFQRP